MGQNYSQPIPPPLIGIRGSRPKVFVPAGTTYGFDFDYPCRGRVHRNHIHTHSPDRHPLFANRVPDFLPPHTPPLRPRQQRERRFSSASPAPLHSGPNSEVATTVIGDEADRQRYYQEEPVGDTGRGGDPRGMPRRRRRLSSEISEDSESGMIRRGPPGGGGGGGGLGGIGMGGGGFGGMGHAYGGGGDRRMAGGMGTEMVDYGPSVMGGMAAYPSQGQMGGMQQGRYPGGLYGGAMPGGGMGMGMGMNQGMMGSPGAHVAAAGLGAMPYAAGYPNQSPAAAFPAMDPRMGAMLQQQQIGGLNPQSMTRPIPMQAANMSHIPAGAFTPGVPMQQRPQSEPPAASKPRPEKRKDSGDGGHEWIPGHSFLDACICTTNCNCRKGHRVLYREETAEGERASGEIRYILKDQLGRDCGDHSGCGTAQATSNIGLKTNESAEAEFKAAEFEAKKEMRRVEEGMQNIMDRLEKMDMKQGSTPTPTPGAMNGRFGQGLIDGGLVSGVNSRQPPIPGMQNPYASLDPGLAAQIDARQFQGIGTPGLPNPVSSQQRMDQRMMAQYGAMPPAFDEEGSTLDHMGGHMMDPSMAMPMGMRVMHSRPPRHPEMMGARRRRSGRGPMPPPPPPPPHDMMGPFPPPRGPPMGRNGRRHPAGLGQISGPGSRRRRPEFPPEDEPYARGGRGGRGRGGREFSEDNDSQWEDTVLDDNGFEHEDEEWHSRRGSVHAGGGRSGRHGMSKPRSAREGVRRGRQAHVEDDEEDEI